MLSKDAEVVRGMMRTFYASPAVHTNGSEEIFAADIDACLSGSPFLSGYVFEEDGEVCGYAMLAKSFSTEFGKPCIWLEDLYVLPSCRGKGLGTAFLRFMDSEFPTCVLRLEAEHDNTPAMHAYLKNGYSLLPYAEMIKI